MEQPVLIQYRTRDTKDCVCVLCAVDCWDGPDGDPVVQHGYTLTSKIPFRAVIETINKYAFVNNR